MRSPRGGRSRLRILLEVEKTGSALLSGVHLRIDSSAFADDPLPYVRRAVAKLDALCLADAKESDRLHIHQRYLGHPHYDRTAARRDLGPQFREML